MNNNLASQFSATIIRIADAHTACVQTKRNVLNHKYNKRYSRTSTRLVDLSGHVVEVGDVVELIQTKPISKNKSCKVIKVLAKATTKDKHELDKEEVKE